MRFDHVKRHMNAKHGIMESVAQRGEGHHFQRQATFESNVRLNDVHHEQPIEDNSVAAWTPDSGKKNEVPEAKHRQMMARISSPATESKDRDVLQGIRVSHRGSAHGGTVPPVGGILAKFMGGDGGTKKFGAA